MVSFSAVRRLTVFLAVFLLVWMAIMANYLGSRPMTLSWSGTEGDASSHSQFGGREHGGAEHNAGAQAQSHRHFAELYGREDDHVDRSYLIQLHKAALAAHAQNADMQTSPQSSSSGAESTPSTTAGSLADRSEDDGSQSKQVKALQEDLKYVAKKASELESQPGGSRWPIDYDILARKDSRPGIVMLAYNRPDYLAKTYESLISLPDADLNLFDVFISLDGDGGSLQQDMSESIRKTLAAAGPRGKETELLELPRLPFQVANPGGTAKLAQHYKRVFDEMFLKRNLTHLVVLEDDMVFAQDFLKLFRETAYLLDRDPTLWCVSSWNDFGFQELVANPHRLFRTDYFPGLGWMLRRELWEELRSKWPADQWDHFMRVDDTHKGRECVVPEISRNFNIGERGTNMANGFYQRYLSRIRLNTQPVKTFAQGSVFLDDLTGSQVRSGTSAESDGKQSQFSLDYLKHDNYEAALGQIFRSATVLGSIDDPNVRSMLSGDALNLSPGISIVTYRKESWSSVAQIFGVMDTPRTTHNGVIFIPRGDHTIALSDGRITPYLPDSLKIHSHPNLRHSPGKQGESCDQTCAALDLPHPDSLSADDSAGDARGDRRRLSHLRLMLESTSWRCHSADFQHVNSCSELQKYFPCEKGCVGGVVGNDVPNYVSNPAKPEFFQMCLTTEHASTCGASHFSSSRLCPCVPA